MREGAVTADSECGGDPDGLGGAAAAAAAEEKRLVIVRGGAQCVSALVA